MIKRLLFFFESGAADRLRQWCFGGNHCHMEIDLEFAAVLGQMQVALFYSVAMPVLLPIVAISLATHRAAFRWLLQDRVAVATTCASPPVGWLLLSLALQAMLVMWFFGAAQGLAYGLAVGTIAFACAVLCWGVLRLRGRVRAERRIEEKGASCNG